MSSRHRRDRSRERSRNRSRSRSDSRDRSRSREREKKYGASREYHSSSLKMRYRDDRDDDRTPSYYRDYYSSRVPPSSRPSGSHSSSTSSQSSQSTNFSYGSNYYEGSSSLRSKQPESYRDDPKKRKHGGDDDRKRPIIEPGSPPCVQTTVRSYPTSSTGAGPSTPRFKIPKRTATAEVAKDVSSPEGTVVPKQQGFTGGRILPSAICATRGDSVISKKGTVGRPITLSANFFKLQRRTDWCLNEYCVKYDPPLETETGLKKALLRQHVNQLQGYIFDGSILYTTCKYPKGLEFISKSRDENETYRLSIQFVKEIDKTDYTYLQFYNILVRKCFQYLDLKLIGRNFFDPKGAKSVQEPGIKLDIYPGYITSIRQYERDVLMNAEIVHKIIRQDSLLSMFHYAYRKHPYSFKDEYSSQVIGMNIITKFNSHTYSIVEVDYEKTPRSTFSMKDGSVISFAEYYKKRSRPILIQDLAQPLLRAKQKRKERRKDDSEEIYLIPELCFPLGLTDDMRSNQRLMRPLANYTRVNARQRMEQLLQFNQRLSQHNKINVELKQWNLSLEKKLVEVPARILEKEIIYTNPGRAIEYNNGDWTRSLRRQLYSVATLTDWFVVYPRRNQQDVDLFIRKFMEAARGFSVPIENQPKFHPIERDDAVSYTTEIERITSRCVPKMIFCFIQNRQDLYSAVKKKCMVDRSVLSQVVQLSIVRKKDLLSVASKVVVQVNAKMGGVPWTVDIKHNGLMVVGLSDARDKSRKENYEAVVATMDRRCTQYYSAIGINKDGNQQTFASNLVKAARAYESENGVKPKCMVIYRDGISDGEVPKVIKDEVDNIKETLCKFYGNPEMVKFAYILVSKKINTRLFFNGENPPGGTVVDDVITNPLKYDFFLVPQNVRSGSVSPTVYNVVHNIPEFHPNDMQTLTYKLSHIYYNWFGTVRIPAPCQYAGKLIRLVSESVKNVPNSELNTTLHYL